ncbi:hypothetical protein D4A92_22705 (plasmid) [Rhizobium rosettiformans]|uniref:SGNH hydrolase-type esterase domain-containing protein n=1 Tax=Rhizobium rosettiformans TaxID=1368430 RepID=A0ABX7F432_9HYPH|nr:GDSL-type esterase/lipase family protein [Rhizobium rosettiformans]QRF54333.1 hypothetical protein D4A92_22705 [Rhizobium rosettiformans]
MVKSYLSRFLASLSQSKQCRSRIFYPQLIVFLSFFAYGNSALASECDPFEVALSTTPVPPQYVHSLKQTAKIRETLADANPDVLLVGDSLIQKWPANDLKNQFKGISVYNAGVGSDRVQNVNWRLKDDVFTKVSPNFVVYLAGTNNLSSQKSCAIIEGIRITLVEIRTLWPNATVVILTIPPRGDELEEYASIIEEVNYGIRTEMPDKKIIALDLHKAFLEACQATTFSKLLYLVGIGSRCELLSSDMLHFSPAGYALIAEKLTLYFGSGQNASN